MSGWSGPLGERKAREAERTWGNGGGVSRCRSCGAAIEWVTTRAGKRMPVDSGRVYTVVTDAGDVVGGRQSHFASCPDAGAWRGSS